MGERKTFPYKGRIIISGPDSTGKSTIVGYKADATEVSRIKNQWGLDSVNEAEGIVNVTGYLNNKKDDRYDFASINDLTPYQGITNAELISSIANDPNFYRTATGNTTGNTAPGNPNVPGSPGTSQPINTPPNNESTPPIEGSHLVYPEDLGSNDQDRIRFQALLYSTTGKGSPADIPVFLPIQSSVTDQNSVGWEPDTINPIELRAVNATLDIMESGSNVTQVATTQFTQALQELRQESSSVRTYLAGQAVGVNNLLSRLEGQVLNPNLELLFQGPQLRPFSFTFKLSARTQRESNVIREIINYFKRNMAAKAEPGDLFVRAPNVFELEYQYKGTKHPGINYIKDCALTNCSIDYTPLGSYMTYENGTMVAYTMTLQFQELEPVYSRDYNTRTNIEY
jgi:hypothetical protein